MEESWVSGHIRFLATSGVAATSPDRRRLNDFAWNSVGNHPFAMVPPALRFCRRGTGVCGRLWLLRPRTPAHENAVEPEAIDRIGANAFIVRCCPITNYRC